MARLNRSAIEAEILKSDDDGYRRKNKKKERIKNDYKVSAEGLPIIRYTDTGKPVSIWTPQLDSKAWEQAQRFARSQFVHPKGLALMADVHVGIDVCVGSVLPTLGALVPSAVGTDIGCGMLAVKLSIKDSQLPDDLKKLRIEIEKRIPVGSGGVHKAIPASVNSVWSKLAGEYATICDYDKSLAHQSPLKHFGTLGSGNHFLEVSVDEDGYVWLVVHSGSRGIGSRIGQYFIDYAARRVDANGCKIGGLGWLPDDDPKFNQYVKSVEFGQRVAAENRNIMLKEALDALISVTGVQVNVISEAINCHHNYIARETHYGEDMWITRKGAIRAAKDQLGIIPSSMGGVTHIVKGLGSEQSYCSCSHGAGRVLSRSAAKNMFTVEDLRRATEGVECRKGREMVDETPQAYKPIKEVMRWQQGLVESVHKLKAVVCVKGC